MSRITIGGLDLFGTDVNGCTWLGEDLTGWGSTGTTLQVTQKQAADGGWPGPSFKKPRLVAIKGNIQGPSSAAVVTSLDSLYAVLAGSPVLTVDDGDGPRTAVVQQQDEVLPTWINDQSCDFSFQMISTDYRKLGPLLTNTCGLPTSTGGLTYPVTYPLTYTGVTTTGTISFPNLGNTLAPVVLRIRGPVTGPIVTHIGSGLQLVFASSLTLGSTLEFIDVDMEAKTVLAQGQSSRAGYVTSRGWFGADPGDNEYAFQAQSPSPTASMRVTVPSGAWL